LRKRPHHTPGGTRSVGSSSFLLAPFCSSFRRISDTVIPAQAGIQTTFSGVSPPPPGTLPPAELPRPFGLCQRREIPWPGSKGGACRHLQTAVARTFLSALVPSARPQTVILSAAKNLSAFRRRKTTPTHLPGVPFDRLRDHVGSSFCFAVFLGSSFRGSVTPSFPRRRESIFPRRAGEDVWVPLLSVLQALPGT